MKRGSYHGALFIALILFSSPFFVPFLVRAVTLPENLAGGGTAAGTFTTSGVTGVSSGGGSTGGSTGGGSTGSGTSGGTSPSSAPSQTTQKSKESGSTDKNANSYPTCKVSATSVSKTSSSNVASSCNASCAPASGQVYDCTKAYNVKCNLNGKVVTNVCNKTGSYSKDGVKISTVCTTAEKDIACKATQCDGKPCTQAQQPTGTGSTGSGKTDGKDGSPTTPGSGSGSGSGSGAGSETPDAKQTVKNFNDCVKQGISKDCAGDNFPEYYKNNPVDSQEALRRELIAGKIACQTDVCRAAHDQEINNLNMSLGQPQFQPIGSQSPGTGGSSVSPTQYNQPTLPHTLPQQFTGANQPGAYQPFKSAGISPEFQPTGSLGTYQQLAGQSILTSAFRPYAPPPMFTQQPLTTQPSFVAPSSFYSPSSLSPAPPPLQQTSYTLPPQYSLSQSAYQQYKSAIAPSTFAPSQTGYQLPAGFSGESNIPYPQTWTQRAGAALVNAGTSAQEAVQALQTYASQGATSLGNYAQSIINPQNQAGSSIGDITNNYPPSFSTQAGANQPNITGATPQSDISMQYPPGFSYFAGATQPNVLGQVPQQGQNILSQYPQSWQNLSLNTGGVPALSTNVPGLGTGGNIGTAAPLDWATQKLSEARDYLQNYQSAVSMGSAEAGQRLSMSQALGCQMSPTACLGGVSSNGIPLALNGSPLYQQIALGQATAPGVGAIPGANLGNPFFGTQTGWQAFNLNGWNPPLAPIGRGGSFESGGGGGGGSQLPFFASDQSYLSADLSGVKAPAAGTLANNVAGISSPAPYANLSGLGTNPTIGKYDFANGVKILPYGSSQLDSALGLRPESGVARNYSAIDSFMQSHTGTTFSPSSVINTPLSSRDAFLASQGITPGSQLGSITEDSLLRMSPTPSRDLVTPRTESGIPFSPPEQSSIGSMYNKNLTPYDDGASAAERARQKMEGLKTNIDDAQVRVDIAAGPYQASEAALKEAENKMRDADFAKFTYDINHLSASHNGVVSKDPKTGDPVYKYSQADYPKAVELQKSVNDSITAYNKALTTRNINAEILNNAIQDHTAAVQTYNNMPARDQALASIGNSIQATNDPVAREQLSHLAGGLANLDSYYGEQAAKQLLSNPSTVEGKFSNQILTDSLAAMDRYGTTGNVLRADYADYMAKQAMNLQPRSPEYTNTLNAAIAEAKRIETGGIDWGYAPRTARDYLAGLSANADRAWQSTSWTEQPGSKAIAGALKVGDFLTTGFAGSMLTSGLNVTGLESLSQKQFDLVNKTPAEISQEQGIHAINLIAVPALGPAAGAVGRGFVAGATWIGERAGPALTRAIETVAGPIGLESRAIIPTSNIRSSINIGGATVSFGDDLARSAGLGTQARLGTAGQFEQAFPTVGRAPSSGISRSLLESPIARLGSETPVARFGGAIGDSYAAGVPRTTTPLTISSIPNASGVRELAYRPPANDNIAPGSAPSGNLTLIQGGKVEAPILQKSATQKLDDFLRANDLPTYVPPVKSDVQLFYEQQAARQAAQSGNVVQFPSGKPFTPPGAVRDLPLGERTGVAGGGAAPASAATKYPTPEQLFRYESREPSVSVYSKKCDVCYLGGDHTGIVIDPGVK
ncbi:hypothetical protein FJY93_04625, partial [Candidatus Kaiserbacteria bacterium]|nr:hypothetical protein [Candidatus Kaiserbacteria bacterium]